MSGDLADSAVILRGNVSDIGFGEILEVLELNPQRLLVSFLRGGEEVGTVEMMSQEVLGAGAAGLSGREAFEQLSCRSRRDVRSAERRGCDCVRRPRHR